MFCYFLHFNRFLKIKIEYDKCKRVSSKQQRESINLPSQKITYNYTNNKTYHIVNIWEFESALNVGKNRISKLTRGS